MGVGAGLYMCDVVKKVHVRYLISRWVLVYLLRLRRYKAKCVKTRCLQDGVGHLEPKFQGEGVVPGEYFLDSTILDTFCYPTVQTAPCHVLSFWHNTSVWWTDGQTDGIAVASTALAMQALRRAVKMSKQLQTGRSAYKNDTQCHVIKAEKCKSWDDAALTVWGNIVDKHSVKINVNSNKWSK